MRQALAQREEQRARFIGTFERFGEKRGWKGRPETTVLLRDICDAVTGRAVCEHLWFSLTKAFGSWASNPVTEWPSTPASRAISKATWEDATMSTSPSSSTTSSRTPRGCANWEIPHHVQPTN
jgi:hypothetical protein